MKTKKLFIFLQLFLLLGAGFFTVNYFTRPTNATGCNIFDDNGGATWDCQYVKTHMNMDGGNVPALNGTPVTLEVGHTYTFHATVTVKNELTNNNYDISIAQVLESPANPATPIDTTGPNAKDLTIEYLSQYRGQSNDLQQAVDANGNNIGANLSWASYACGSIVHYTSGNQPFTIDCKFTPSKTGYFQMDTNSEHFSQSGSDCVHGLCGPIGAIFIKVVKTPEQPNVMCTNLSVTDQSTGQTYTTSGSPISQDIAPLTQGGVETNQQRTMVTTINGTTNQNPLGIKWLVRGAEAFNGTVWNQDSANVTQITPDNTGKYTNTYQFTFGPFSTTNGSNANIQDLDHYSFSVLPVLFIKQNGSWAQYNTEALNACDAGLTTKAAPSIHGGSTSAEVTITKRLITAEPIPVGQTATFKIVITNSGQDSLKTVDFHDMFQDNNIMDFSSGTGFETNHGVNTTTKDLGLTASNGTTSTIDLTALFGQPLSTGDTFTINLTFLGKAAGTNIDTAICKAISTTDSKVLNCSDQASVTFSPPPTAPNTGAETPLTLGAIVVLIAGAAGKKYALKFITL